MTTYFQIDNFPKYAYFNRNVYEVNHYELEIYAVKSEDKSQRIPIEQSNKLDRKHARLNSYVIETIKSKENRFTLRRLHISATTRNNQLVDKKLNKNQKYFNLIVEFRVKTMSGESLVIHAVESENRIISRVGNIFQYLIKKLILFLFLVKSQAKYFLIKTFFSINTFFQ